MEMERNREMPAFETMWRNLAQEVEQGGDLKRGRRSSTQLRRGSFVAKKSFSQAGRLRRMALGAEISLTTYMGRIKHVGHVGYKTERGAL